MERRKFAVRLLAILGGALAVGFVIFLGIPWFLDEVALPRLGVPAPEVEMTEEEIVRQALDSLAEEVVNRGPDEEGESQVVAALEETTSPLVALRENGETLPVLFPRPEEEGVETAQVLQGAAPAPIPAQAETPPQPPELDGSHPQGALALRTDVVIPVVSTAAQSPSTPGLPEETPPQGPVLVAEARGGETVRAPAKPLTAKPAGTNRPRPVFGPSPGAVRELQELLSRLGYEPGPVDGVWGPRTARAWRSFARDTGAPAASAALDPSRGAEDPEASGAGQAGPPPPGLPAEPEGAVVPGTLRGVMGYRMPLVSRQELPDQVVSGVLMPAHTTFVILKPGYWELTGLTPEEARILEQAADREKRKAEAARRAPAAQQPARGWNPLKLFRRGN